MSGQGVKGQVIVVTCEYPPFPGGIGTYSGRMAEALRDRGMRVVAITPRYPGMAGSVPAGIDQYSLLGHHTIPISAIPRLLGVLRAAPRDAMLLAADIRTAMLLWALRGIHGRPYRVMVHGSEASKLAGRGPLAAIARRAYAGAELVAYNSEATRAIFRASGVRPSREVLSYLGVDRSWFAPVPEGPFDAIELREMPSGTTVLCTVGRLEARKGHLEAVEAIALAATRLGRQAITYVAAGHVESAQYRNAVIAAAARLNVHVVLPGRLGDADVMRLYHRSVAHLLCARAMPGRIEGFGLVLLEAAAQGCPSIATRVGGIPEVLGSTGTLVNEGDTEALATAIVDFVQDKPARDLAGIAARERAARFDWDACAAATFPDRYAGPIEATDGDRALSDCSA